MFTLQKSVLEVLFIHLFLSPDGSWPNNFGERVWVEANSPLKVHISGILKRFSWAICLNFYHYLSVAGAGWMQTSYIYVMNQVRYIRNNPCKLVGNLKYNTELYNDGKPSKHMTYNTCLNCMTKSCDMLFKTIKQICIDGATQD